MRCNSLTNITDNDVDVELRCGSKITLAPGATINNVDVSNFSSISALVQHKIRADEIMDRGNRQRLLD